MSVGVWNPDGEKGNFEPVSNELLDRFCACAGGTDEQVDIESLAQHGLEDQAVVMKLDAAAWQGAETLSTEKVIALIRFFTLVEMQVAGWDAGKSSPVIPLVSILKGRGEFDAGLRKWIKSSTSNRYLPYGSAL